MIRYNAFRNDWIVPKTLLERRKHYADPNILPRELYSDEVKTGEKFDTL